MIVSYVHTMNYTELSCICVVGSCKMPIYEAKHEYILYYLYLGLMGIHRIVIG